MLKERFIKDVGLIALVVGKEFGYDPKILIAQSALETGWGRAVISNNYFNIKGGDIAVMTTEYEEGKAKKMTEKFKAYDTVLESFVDYAKLIDKSLRYEIAKHLKRSPRDYFIALQKAGYATDPAYAAKCYATYLSIPENWLDIIVESITYERR